MPRRDHVIYRYTLQPLAGQKGAGQKYRAYLDETDGLWAEVVQVTTPVSNMGQQSTYSNDTLYKVRMQTPDLEYSLELTRFLWVWKGREHYLQPYKCEVRSGTRSEICMYYCKKVSDFR